MMHIAVLKLGWVLIGILSDSVDSQRFTLSNASVVRVWGTTKGLGQLAQEGKTNATILDPVGIAYVERAACLFLIPCNPDAWSGTGKGKKK